MLEDYDLKISYHPGKANRVAVALSRKTSGTLASLWTKQQQLIAKFEELEIETMESTDMYLTQLC